MANLRQADLDKITAVGLHPVDRRLYLQVRGPASRSWIFRYTFRGQQRSLGLGSARDVTLAQARDLRDDKLAVIRQGVDPVTDRQDAKVRARAAERSGVTFIERAEQYLAAHEDGWSNAKHREQWRSTLSNYVYPAIGKLPAAKITTADIVDLLRPIWSTKAETARRIRGRIESVLDYAADPDDTTYRNPAAMSAQLLKKLPKAKRNPKNHPALPYNDAPAFFADLGGRAGMAARALEFAILTAARTSEVLGARWDEIDTANRLWVVPAERMKMRQQHRVPLSDAAMAVLGRAGETRVGAFVFPSLPHDRPASNMAMLAVLKRMERHAFTTHGFRSTFRDWAGDCTDFDRQTIEFALAHGIDDKTEAAYRRSTALAKRRELMELWGRFCTNAPADVVHLQGRR
jgi:integrase